MPRLALSDAADAESLQLVFSLGPEWTHQAGVWVNHFAELVAPFGYFLPQPVASIAAIVTIVFQALIMASGNFSWLNLLTIVLAIPALDDRFLAALLPGTTPQLGVPSLPHKVIVAMLVLLVAVLSVRPIANMLPSRQIMNTSFNPLRLVGTYGAFGGITRTRYEVVVEGTSAESPSNATEWRQYEFRGKPTDTRRRPPQVAPYHLRLDWLMWFAAMDDYTHNPWFVHFMGKLLEGDRDTLGLFLQSVSRSSSSIRARGALPLRVHVTRRAQTNRPMVETPGCERVLPEDLASKRRTPPYFSGRGLAVDPDFAAAEVAIYYLPGTPGAGGLEGTMKNTRTALAGVAAGCCLVLGVATTIAQTPKPKHINRAIELLSEGQPVYYTGSHSGTEGTFEQGKRDAQTYADYISYDMEHAPFDVKGLADYMKGLVAGGPTKSGHRTPAVIVNVPVNGTDEATVRANAWMFQQVLATGVHGIMLTHADTPGAIRAFVEAVRFPIHKEGVGPALSEGRRGAHGTPTAAEIWGVSNQEYENKADVWPLNPNGELLLGIKVEDKYALDNAEQSLKVPGIGFAEWGPGDMALSLGIRTPNAAEKDPRMLAARARVFAACKANKVFFLNSMNPNNVIDMIKEGVMVGPANQQATEIGRQYTKRKLPW